MPAPAPPFPPLACEPPPPATTSTSTCVTPLGTENVPDEVNDCCAGALTVIEKALSLVFELLSFALIVKLDVVLELTASGVPEIT